jgi:hypothetical protein
MEEKQLNQKLHSVLPHDAQRLLTEAAKAAQKLHGLGRQRTLQAAIERVKREHPEYFKP